MFSVFHFLLCAAGHPAPSGYTGRFFSCQCYRLRITNLNPYFTIHSDSTLSYNLEINKDEKKYYWFLRNSPVGLRINKDDGVLTFKAEKSFFLSGKLKYDVEYKVNIGVQNLSDPQEQCGHFFYHRFL